MTREEAIALLQPFRDCMVDQHGCPISDVVYALDVALDVLRKADRNGQERTGTDKHFVGTSKKVIDGLKMTMDLFLFNPSTGETLVPDDLNELNRITYDACKGAIELLSLQSEHATCYLDSPCEYQNSKIALPSAQPDQRWIPIKMRPMDAEERKGWSEKLWYELDDEEAVMFDCPLPDDGQEVWVCSKHGNVWQDTCQIDDGIYLEENGDWIDIVAWMPFNRPEPYKDDPCNGCDYLGESCVGEGCGKLTERKEGETDE